MKITRHNYEEFFILYLDNELSNDERSAVELFVKENPDLQPELDVLFQSQLSVDTEVVFPGKEALLKKSGPAINESNYEQWLLSYIDNELAETQKNSLEQFIAARPAIRAELEILQKTKLQPEHIVFRDKSSLYRREEKVRVIAINWRRIAIAATLILAVGTTVVVFNSKKENATDIADTGNKKMQPATVTKPAMRTAKEAELENPQLAVINKDEPVKGDKENVIASNNKQQVKRPAPVVEKNAIDEIKKGTTAAINGAKGTNDLPEPIYNPNVKKVSPQDNPIAMNDTRVPEPLTISKETNAVTSVTPVTAGTLYPTNTSPEPGYAVDESQPGKKNKLRGFFRKVTRTFEKNTNIKATDDEDRLLLGGLAIKL